MHPALPCIALLAALAADAGAAPRYAALDIGNLGARGVTVSGLNARGQVIGESERPQNLDFPHAFATGPGGIGMVDLCPTHDESCGASAIDDAGEVTGSLADAGAFTVHADGSGFQALSVTLALNGLSRDGHVVGERVVSAAGGTHAVVGRGLGQPLHDLGSLTGPGGQSQGYGVNASGVVVGCSAVAAGSQHAFVVAGAAAGMRDLGTLGGPNSCALAVSDRGVVVGWADVASGSTHAAFADAASGGWVDIGTLGRTFSQATAVNVHGVAVGLSTFEGGGPFDTHAFVYDTRSRELTDLNTLADLPAGVVLDTAMGINRSGQIAASSTDGRGWLLTPLAQR